ncbi:MAG: hypothetical protein WB561_06590 [Terracidiphilus sp.]
MTNNSLTDFGSSYSNVAKLKTFPADGDALIALPVILAVIPLIVVIEELLKAMR